MKTKKISADDVSAFVVPPQNQGQILEIAYAWVAEGGMIQRVIDRSEPPGSPLRETHTYLEIDPIYLDEIDLANGILPQDHHVMHQCAVTILGSAS